MTPELARTNLVFWQAEVDTAAVLDDQELFDHARANVLALELYLDELEAAK